MRKRTLKLLLALALVGLAASVTSAADPIKVGAPLCLTGPYAADGLGYWRGIEIAVEEINAAGGLLGRQLEIVKFDTQDLAPERVMLGADQLVGKEKVDSVHGGWAGWGQDVRAYGKYDVPFFMWDASINAISVFRENPEQYANVFQLNDVERPLAADIFDMMVKLPHDYPNKKIAIVTADDSWGLESAAGMKARAKEAGWKIVLEETVPYGTREWGPIMSKIRKAKPAIIYVEIVYSPDLITFFKSFQKAPTQSLINFGYGLSLPDFLENIGPDGNGLMGETTGLPGPEPPTPAAAEWMARFRSKYDAEPTAGSFAVYTGVKIWAQAVRAVGDVKDYAAINAHIAATPYESMAGKTLTFDEDHKITTQSWPLSHLQIQDGRYVTLFHGSDTPYKHYTFQPPPWITE